MNQKIKFGVVCLVVSSVLGLAFMWLCLEKKPTSNNSGGERGIRTPGTFRLNGFQDHRIRPLCHLSAGRGEGIDLSWLMASPLCG